MRHGDVWFSDKKTTFILSDFGKGNSTKQVSLHHGNPDKARIHCYEMAFQGANPSVKSQGQGKLKRYHNYYTSSNARNWQTGVPLFSTCFQKDLYPGIDLQWKESSGNLKYEFFLSPGANPDQIRIRYTGLDGIKLDKGNLILETSLGNIQEQKPIAWQTDRYGRKMAVSCRFRLQNGVSGFEFPSGYNPALPLVIDPILVFSSFSGSRSDNWGFTATYGEESSPYAAGIALGPRFPVTPGAYSANYAGDSVGVGPYSTYDIGILKFNPSGTELLYATYIGGSEAEAPASIVVDKDSNLVLLGSSSSAGYPVTSSAFDTSFNGGSLVSPYGPDESIVQFRQGSDIVVSKFSKDGRNLLASTFIGGSGNDGILTLLQLGTSPLVKNYGDSFRGEVITDEQGRIYLASHTLSLNFPMVSPVQPQLGGGSDAVFVVLSPELDSIKFSTYHGGSEDDAAYALQFGNGGEVYLSGGTASPDFPSSNGTVKPFFGGVVDGYISKFRLGNSTQVRSTFLGTNRYDQSYFVQVDKSGNVYAYGQTVGNYPVSPGVYSNPGSAQFIHCLSPNLDSTRFSTVFGSGTLNPNISPTAFLVDDCGRIYCSGWGGSTNTLSGYANGNTIGLPTTPASGTQETDGSDFYILVLESNASGIVFGTFFGDSQSFGEHVDGGTSRFDKRGVIYQAVCAGCGGFSSFPTTPGVVSNVNASTNCNNAIFVYDFSKLQARYTSTSTGGCIPLTLKFKSVSIYDQQVKWDFDDGTVFIGNSQDSVAHTFQNTGIYKVKLVAYNPEGCPSKDSTIQTITIQKPVLFSGDTLRFCSTGDTISTPSLPSGELTYSWEPAVFLDNPASPKVRIIQPDSSLWYTATVRTSEGCTSEARFLLRDGRLSARALADTLRGCAPLSVNFSSLSRNAKIERWYFGDGDSASFSNPNATVSHTYNQAGLFTAILKVMNDTACSVQAFDTVLVEVLSGPFLADTLVRFCESGNLGLQAPAGQVVSWIWSPGTFLSDSTIANPVFLNAMPMVFDLKAKDSNSCVSRSKVEVRDGRLKAAFSLPNIPLCAPAVLQLDNLSLNPVQSTFYWGQDSVTVPGQAPVQISIPRGGRYNIRLRVLSDTACISFADTSQEISLGGPGNTGPDSLWFCPDDSVLLQAPIGSGFQYQWPPDALIGTDSSQGLFFPGESRELLVTITDSLQCTGTSRYFLSKVVLDTSFNLVSEFDPCTDLLQYRFSTAALPENEYQWSVLEDSVSLFAPSVQYVFPERNTYRIRLITRKEPCIISREKVLEVSDPPINLAADFSYQLIYEDCAKEPKLKIENKSTGAISQRWTWNGGNSELLQPVPSTSGLDSIQLRLEVFQGTCSKEITKFIKLNPLLPPNLVTLRPDGLNDEFTILHLPENSSIEIWDRWGKKVLEENPYKNNWKPEHEGIYFYQLRFGDGASCTSWFRAAR
jgi:PKD repeat protein